MGLEVFGKRSRPPESRSSQTINDLALLPFWFPYVLKNQTFSHGPQKTV